MEPKSFMSSKKDIPSWLPAATLKQGEGAAVDFVAILRNAQAVLPCGAVLRAAGATLLAAGSIWAGLVFIKANPFVFLILAGVACLLASLATERDGLLSYLPEGAQQFLMREGTIFDFFHDDTAVHNVVRKWGRVQLLALQDGQSEGTVQKIVDSMEPELLDLVLRRPFISFLPPVALRLLLPEAAFSPSELSISQGRARGSSSPGTGSSKKPAADAGTESTACASSSRSSAPSLPWIMTFLQERNKEKIEKLIEPGIGPLLSSTMGVDAALKTFGRSAMAIFKVIAASAASGWMLSAGLLYCGSGTRLLVRGLTASGVMRPSADDAQIAKASRWATAFSLLSAGGAIALTAYCHRFMSSMENSRSSETRAPRPFEPEREESPPDSEASKQDVEDAVQDSMEL